MEGGLRAAEESARTPQDKCYLACARSQPNIAPAHCTSAPAHCTSVRVCYMRSMANALPAVALAAVPGRRRATLDLAREIERRGFSGIYCPSFGDGLGLCEALALCTNTIEFGTAIVNIYARHAFDYATTVTLIHELSRGRFR